MERLSHSSKRVGAEARVIAGGKALIVELRAEVERVDVSGHLPWVSRFAQEAPDEFIHSDRFGTGQLDRAIPITEVAAEPLIGLTREDYPNYYDYLSILFSKLKQKPRVVEEHDSFSGIISAVEAGTGVTIGMGVFGHSFGNRVKLLHLSPEPKPISVGIVGTKGRLSPAAEKFWQYAKEAAAKK